jgi:hypothetical protein
MRCDSGKFACHHRRVRRSAGGKDEKVPKISLQQRNKAAAAERQGDRNNFVNSIRCDYSRSPYLSPPPCPVPASSADSKDVSVAACRQSCRTRATRLLHFGSSRHHSRERFRGPEVRCRQVEDVDQPEGKLYLLATRVYSHRSIDQLSSAFIPHDIFIPRNPKLRVPPLHTFPGHPSTYPHQTTVQNRRSTWSPSSPSFSPPLPPWPASRPPHPLGPALAARSLPSSTTWSARRALCFSKLITRESCP